MRRCNVYLALACLCTAGFLRCSATPTPLNAWSSSTYLSRSVEHKSVPSAQALEELFGIVAGAASGSPAALDGLVNAQQLTEQRPDAVVVVASAEEACSPAVAQKLAQLTNSVASHLQLPNAVHTGPAHPVFASLRRAARRMRVRVLGSCGESTAGAGPATAAALRAELEGAAGGKQPTVVVLCPAPGTADSTGDDEAALLEAAEKLLAELVPRHLLIHASYAASASAAGQQALRRHLAEARRAAVKESAANRTQNYTVCDATCQKHVVWMQGLVVLVVLLMALCIGCTCMHMVDVPTRFAQPEASRQHQD